MGQRSLKPPPTLAIVGPGSNSGKTTLVEGLIRHLRSEGRRVAAFKIASATPDHRCGRTGLACGCLDFDGRYHVVRDPEIVGRAGKDTGAFLEAGAALVWWIQATRESAPEALEAACQELPEADVLIVEGSAPVRTGTCDLAVAVAPVAGKPPKDGYAELLPRCDLVARCDLSAVEPPSPHDAETTVTFDASGQLDARLVAALDRVLPKVIR